MKTLSRRGLLAVVAVLLMVAPACSRVERVTVDGVDCVVAKSGKSIRALDCNWPNEDNTNSTDSPQ